MENKYFIKGNSHIIVIILVLVGLIIAASAGSYYLLKSQGKAPQVDTSMYKPNPTTNKQETNSNDDIDTLDTELENTTTGSFDTDIEGLNSEAASL